MDPVQRTTGPVVYLRDFFEALSQRWNRYVLGYDLRTQMRLAREVSSGYEALRRRSGATDGFFGNLTRPRSVALIGPLALVGGFLAWRARGRFRRRTRQPTGIRPATQAQLSASALYQQLEGALAVHGVVRAPGLPPLLHAKRLESDGHPLATEVCDLTEIYLEARFGGKTLRETERKDFERRVASIRSHVPLTTDGDGNPAG
jgi:hypothetical protein